MDDGADRSQPPKRDSGAAGKRAVRRARSAAALRENLRRRKTPGVKPGAAANPGPADDAPDGG